jgi:hypothetical protein
MEIITINGVDFPNEELLDAYESAADDDGNVVGVGQAGRVVVMTDGDEDPWAKVGRTDTGEDVYENLAESGVTVAKPFDAYVREDVLDCGTYETSDPPRWCADYVDVVASEHDDGTGMVLPEDIESAFDDDDVRVEGVSFPDGLMLADER